MTDPFVTDRAWAQRMEFLSALMELPVEDQLAFMAHAVEAVIASRTNHLQLMLWETELDRQWRVVDAQPGVHVIG